MGNGMSFKTGRDMPPGMQEENLERDSLKDELVRILLRIPPSGTIIIGRKLGKRFFTASHLAEHLIAGGVTLDKYKPAPQLMPMGAVTYAVACRHCVNRRWTEKCRDCMREVQSGFELDANTFLQWIPVSERLPEVQTRVLAVTESGYIHMDCIRKCDGTWFQESFDSAKITHWMPLPEPPEVKKDA